MGFQEYLNRPITRLAYQLQETDHVQAIGDVEYCVRVEDEDVFFKARSTPDAGDFVIYNNDDDVYLCPEDTFLAEHVV